MLPSISETIGPYRITGLIGSGGMGAVYRCVHPDRDTAVAIKTVPLPHESLLPAIRREIHALRKLRHPGIVRILDSGTNDGIPWYAMELLGQRSMADFRDELWASGPPAPGRLREALTILRRLCEPLAYLHGEGMVHGDIKPENVLLGADRRPVLIDLGLLTAFGEHPSRDALDTRLHGAGSAAYMAPEQIEGEPVDARADLYAVGCVLYGG
jgi:serine/threonine protein kinase